MTIKNFTAKFDLTGNLESKFPAIKRMVDSLKNVEHKINFKVNDSEVIQKTKNVSSALEKAANATKGHSEAQKNSVIWNNALGKAAGAVTEAVNKGTDSTNKHKSAVESLQGRYKSFTGSLGDVKDKLGGIFALMSGAAIAGISWVAAQDSASYKSSVMERLGARVGTRKVDTAALEEFVKKATDSGYSSGTDRLQLANLLITRGSKNTATTIKATDALEKIYFKDNSMFQRDFGINSAQQLAEMATSKKVSGDTAKDLDYIFGKGFSKLSQSARIKKLGRMGEDIDIGAAMEADPLAVIQTRMKSVTKSIGEELRGPMNLIAGLLANILGMVDKNPILPKILAIGAALMAVSGVLVSIVAVLPLLKTGIGAVSDGFKIAGSAAGNFGKLANFSKMSGFLMGPWGILIALAAILLIVAWRTGKLQDAWDKFSSSAIGKDFLSLIGSASDLIGGLIERFGQWYESSGKNQMLDYFFKFCEVLSYAWDYIDKIYSTMRGGGANPLLAGMIALSNAPAALVAGGIKAFTGKGPEEHLENISAYIWGLAQNFAKTSPFLAKIHDVMKRVQSILDWLWQLLQGFWSWIQKAMPGAAKETKRQEMMKEAEKEGLYLSKQGLSEGWWKDYKHPTSGVVSKVRAMPKPKLAKLQGEYEALPGFAEGISDAVRSGLSGMGDTIADKIAGAFPEFDFPDFTSLTESINNLINAISNWNPVKNLPGSPTIVTSASKVYWPTNGGEPLTEDEWMQIPAGERIANYRYSSSGNPWGEGHASGLTFTKGGMFAGKVHEYEELVGVASYSKGKGLLARAIDDLDAVMNGRPSVAGIGVDGGRVVCHLHQENNFDFTGSKFSKDMDLEAFFTKMDGRVRKVAVDAVKDAIGKRR